MGAGSISKYMRELKFIYELELVLKKFSKNISNNIDLSNYSWFNLGGPAEYFLNLEIKIS